MVTESEVEILNSAFLEASKIVIVSHFNPDGDAVGSCVGCYHFLKHRGKDSQIILPNKVADYLQFLNPEEKPFIYYNEDVEKSDSLISEADLIVCLDFNKLSRTEFIEESISKSTAKKILIDHHLNPERCEFDFVISQIQTSSASELLFWTLYKMPDIAKDIFKMSMESANALYTGMMTDTNNFSNSVLPSTFEMASKLIERGVQKNRIQEIVLNCYSADRMRLMGYLLRYRMKYIPSMNAAYITLSQKDKHNYNFQIGDSEGFVNLPLSILGVNVSAFFSESYSNDNFFIKVSLRSKGDFDVNRFAKEFFNGGGHKNASGGKLFMPLCKVPRYFEKSLNTYLKELESESE